MLSQRKKYMQDIWQEKLEKDNQLPVQEGRKNVTGRGAVEVSFGRKGTKEATGRQ